MEHNQKSPVEPIKSSSNYFGAEHQNNFVVLDDAEHVIGVHPGNGNSLIFENIKNGLTVEFGERIYPHNYITSLLYDQDSGSLFSGDNYGYLVQYKVNTANKTCEEVKYYGYIGIGGIMSCARFMHFVFFGGWRKIRVMDLSTDKLLPGHLKTLIDSIYSLQVCKKNEKEIYLAVSGWGEESPDVKNELLDISGLLSNDPVIFQKKYFESSNNYDETILGHKVFIKSQADKIKSLELERDSYKQKYNEIKSEYDDLKKKHEHFQKQNTELTKDYETLKVKFDIKHRQFFRKISILYNQNKRRTNLIKQKSLIGKRSFDEMEPLVTIRKMREDIQKEKHLNRQLQDTVYTTIDQRRAAKDESRVLRVEMDTVKSDLKNIREVVDQM